MLVRDKRILELLDLDAIDTALSTYCRGIDRHDVDIINSAYFPDAQDNHGPFRNTVSNGFAQWGNALHAGKTRAHMHNLTTRWVELQGDVASTDTYVLFALLLKDRDEVELGSGRYLDRLERRDGSWRIARRRTTIDMRMTADARVWFSAPGGYVTGKWDRTDLSYQRPVDLSSEQRAELQKKGAAPPREDSPAAHGWEVRLPDPEARLQLIVARRAVAACIGQSVRGLDRGEAEVARSAFSSNAVVISGQVATPFGDHIRSELTTAEAEDEAQARHITTHNARIDGDEAVAETYVIEMRRRRSGSSVWSGGWRMLDRLSRKAGRWEVSQRTLIADWELESPEVSFNPADGYLRSVRGTGDPLELDARDQSGGQLRGVRDAE
jgi:hypothetical protein